MTWNEFERTARGRWVRFLLVGAVGLAVQILTLEVLLHLGFPPLTASLLGVEVAVLHNFLGHRRWTWKDRPALDRRDDLGRLGRFHLTSGATSLVGHAMVVPLSLRLLEVQPLVANLQAILVCGLVNFLLADLYAFRQGKMLSEPDGQA